MALLSSPPIARPAHRSAPAAGTPWLAVPWLAALLLAVLLAGALLLGTAPAVRAQAQPQAHAPQRPTLRLQAHRPGEEMVLARCLHVSVLDLLDRNGPLAPDDWVTLRVTNECTEPVRHLLVDLLLVDVMGKVYGRPLWVLQGGEVLWPGRSKTDRYPVPDNADHMPRQWTTRLRYVETPHRRYEYTPPARLAVQQER